VLPGGVAISAGKCPHEVVQWSRSVIARARCRIMAKRRLRASIKRISQPSTLDISAIPSRTRIKARSWAHYADRDQHGQPEKASRLDKYKLSPLRPFDKGVRTHFHLRSAPIRQKSLIMMPKQRQICRPASRSRHGLRRHCRAGMAAAAQRKPRHRIRVSKHHRVPELETLLSATLNNPPELEAVSGSQTSAQKTRRGSGQRTC